MRPIRTAQLLEFAPDADAAFVEWLDATNRSVVFGHGSRVIACGRDESGDLATDHAQFQRVTGLATDQRSLRVVDDHELWTLTDGVGPGQRSPTGADRWMMCRGTRFVGGVRPADPAIMGDDVWFVSVTLSAVCSLDETLSASIRWVPPFVSSVVPETRCRLTGLGVREGRAEVVTSVSTSDVADGWIDHRVAGGVMVDIRSGETIVSGLSMPHSPRWHEGRWWMLQAGTGELGYVDGDAFVPVARVDGFVRGLTIVEGCALMATSGSRWGEIVDGLAVGERLAASGKAPIASVTVVDLTAGVQRGCLRLDGTGREISDVVTLADTRRVQLSGPHGVDAQDWTTFPTDFDPAATRP